MQQNFHPSFLKGVGENKIKKKQMIITVAQKHETCQEHNIQKNKKFAFLLRSTKIR